MKKFLLSALALAAVSSAYAGVEGTYVATKYAGFEVGDNYKFSSGSAWSSEDATEEGDDSTWEIIVAASGDSEYTVTNLIGWEEEAKATFNPETNVLTIKGGTAIYTDDSGIVSYICGGLDGYSTAKGVMDYCDANNGWIAESRGLNDVELKLEDGKLVAATCILTYTDYYPGYGYHGIAISVISQLEMEPNVTEPDSDNILGSYVADKYAGCDVGDNYKFSSGSSWSSEDITEDDDPWIVNVALVDDAMMIENLIGWEDAVPCSFDNESAELVIKGGTVVYVDESGIESMICGGLEGYTSAKSIMDYCDANNGWIYETRGLLDIKLVKQDDKLVAQTPILVYTNYYPGYGYHGIAISLTSELQLTRSASGICSMITETNAPVEYYNMQGVKVSNPMPGQLVIKRQGNQAVKMIIR